MSMPDLDTADISFIAFWNHLDNGATDITPMDATSAMDTHMEYGNGVDGQVTVEKGYSPNRTANVRVKDDGWILAWFDRTEDDAQNVLQGTRVDGPYDIVNNWDLRNSWSLVQNRLERVVNDLRNALSNTAAAAYSSSDVGLYNFASESATNVHISNVHAWGGDGSTYGSTTETYSVLPDVSNLYDGWCLAATANQNYGNLNVDQAVWAVNQEGVNMATVDSSDNYFGAREIVDRGEIAPGEEVTMNCYTDSYDNNYNGGRVGVLLTFD